MGVRAETPKWSCEVKGAGGKNLNPDRQPGWEIILLSARTVYFGMLKNEQQACVSSKGGRLEVEGWFVEVQLRAARTFQRKDEASR